MSVVQVLPYPAAAGAAGDPYWEYVVFLSGFEGTDGDTSTLDESPAGNDPSSFGGDAHIEDSQFKFGSTSLALDGSGDWVIIPHSTDFNLHASDFTAEAWVRLNAASGEAAVFGKWANNDGEELWLYFNASGEIVLDVGADGISMVTVTSGSHGMSSNTWHHCVWERSGNTWRTYVDGAMISKATSGRAIIAGERPLYIGRLGDADAELFGFIDEVRITKGVARYASDGGYSVPTEAYPRIPAGVVDETFDSTRITFDSTSYTMDQT